MVQGFLKKIDTLPDGVITDDLVRRVDNSLQMILRNSNLSNQNKSVSNRENDDDNSRSCSKLTSREKTRSNLKNKSQTKKNVWRCPGKANVSHASSGA